MGHRNREILSFAFCLLIAVVVPQFAVAGGGVIEIQSTGVDFYQSTILDQAPIAYWRLGGTGTTYANLGSLGAAANATFVNQQGFLAQNSTPLIASTANMSGNGSIHWTQNSTDYLVADPFSMPTTAATYSFWFQGDTDSLRHFVGYGGGNEFTARQTGGNVGILVNGGAGEVPASISDGTPKHIVMTWDSTSGEVEVFVDGTSQGRDFVSTTPLTSGLPLVFGHDLDSDNPAANYNIDASQSINGYLDEVAIFDRVLDPLEIQQQFLVGSGALIALTPEPSTLLLLAASVVVMAAAAGVRRRFRQRV